MARLLAIDFGRKRCGVAVTDPLRIVATALDTVRTCDLPQFVAAYMAREQVDAVIVGNPTDMRGNPSESMRYIAPAVERLRKALPPGTPVIPCDERFTSVLAHRAMLDAGVKKAGRRDKAAIDRMSAVIMLNDYLNSLNPLP